MNEPYFGDKILTMETDRIPQIVINFLTNTKNIKKFEKKDFRHKLTKQLKINFMTLNLYMKFWVSILIDNPRPNDEAVESKNIIKNVESKNMKLTDIDRTIFDIEKSKLLEKLKEKPIVFLEYLKETFGEKGFIDFYYSSRYTYFLAKALETSMHAKNPDASQNTFYNFKVINALVAQIHANKKEKK